MPHAEKTRWFTEEVQPHDAKLKAYLRSTFPTVRDVDDVVQESYLRVWRARATQPIRLAQAFLFTVARRIALDWVRREQRAPFVAVKDSSQLLVLESGAPDASAETEMEIQLLAEAVESLPPRCREIFVLCQVEGLTQAEVARRLGIAKSSFLSADAGDRLERVLAQTRLERPPHPVPPEATA
ncbi:MAG: RNA polymerase sigma factor [Opitutaceae bacterium]